MPPRRRTAAPPIDVDDLRTRLGLGKIVRVAIANGAQFPPGSVGRVRRIGDPEIDGEEYIQVELTVNGTKDLLPFAPADLTTPSKGSGTNGGSVPVRANGVPPTRADGAAPRTNGAAQPGGGGSSRTGALGATKAPLAPPDPSAASAPVERISYAMQMGPPETEPDTGPSPATDRPIESPPRPKPTRAKPAAKRRGPPVTISIGTTDADPPQWRIEAKVGSKMVLRNGSVPPARVWELVGMLGDETVTRAVGSVLDEQRQAARSRAEALTAELARVQAELAELPEPASAP